MIKTFYLKIYFCRQQRYFLSSGTLKHISGTTKHRLRLRKQKQVEGNLTHLVHSKLNEVKFQENGRTVQKHKQNKQEEILAS